MNRLHQGTRPRSEDQPRQRHAAEVVHSPHLLRHSLTNEKRAIAAPDPSTSPVTTSGSSSWQPRESARWDDWRVLQNYLAANLNLLSKKWRTQRYQRAVLQIMSATIILGAQWGDEGKVRVHCFRSRGGAAIGLHREQGHFIPTSGIIH